MQANPPSPRPTPCENSSGYWIVQSVFIGNDSGPGHLASFCGIPTFTLFGPQLPEWFAPLHPTAEWLNGKACPYKPCSDYCRFDIPICMTNWSFEEVWPIVNRFLGRVMRVDLAGTDCVSK